MGETWRNRGISSREELGFFYRLLQHSQKPASDTGSRLSGKRKVTSDHDDTASKRHAPSMARKILPKGSPPPTSHDVLIPRSNPGRRKHPAQTSRIPVSPDGLDPSMPDKHAIKHHHARTSGHQRPQGDVSEKDAAMPLGNSALSTMGPPPASSPSQSHNARLHNPDFTKDIASLKRAKVRFRDANKGVSEFTAVFDPRSERSFATKAMINRLGLQPLPWKPHHDQPVQTLAGLLQVRSWVWVRAQAPHLGFPSWYTLNVPVIEEHIPYDIDFCFGKPTLENIAAQYPGFKKALKDLCGDRYHELEFPPDESPGELASGDVNAKVGHENRLAIDPDCPIVGRPSQDQPAAGLLSPALSMATRPEPHPLGLQPMPSQFDQLLSFHMPTGNNNNNAYTSNTLFTPDWIDFNFSPTPGPANTPIETGQAPPMELFPQLEGNFTSPYMDMHQHMPLVSVGFSPMTSYPAFHDHNSDLLPNFHVGAWFPDEK